MSQHPIINTNGMLFYGEIKEGKLSLFDTPKFKSYLKKQKDGMIVIEVTKKKKLRSLNENAYYWGVVIKILSDEFGYFPEQMHEALKIEFLGVKDKNGLIILKSTTKLSTSEFEAYLRKGKAPSVKLAEAFRTFKNWLTSIYRSLRALDVEINEEISNVFDRMLASEAEIKEADIELEKHEEFLTLHECITKLPAKYQEVIMLRFFEKKQLKEISEILQKNEGTVKSLLHRGLERLRRLMEELQLSSEDMVILNRG